MLKNALNWLKMDKGETLKILKSLPWARTKGQGLYLQSSLETVGPRKFETFF